MGWVLPALGIILAIALIAVSALAICRRYCGGRQCGARTFWIICEECRQKLSWLWAPREEKVGLVKAQHPTAQAVPGLYRQPDGTSQYILHSESDLRLDAQGAFTRFEAVDRDLHPPLGGATAIPPQPLRPAPQPRPIARPRPSPLQAPSASDILRIQDSGPGPLTPPPQSKPPTLSRFGGPTSTTPNFFHFETNQAKDCKLHKATVEQSGPNHELYNLKTGSEASGPTSHATPNPPDDRINESYSQFEPQNANFSHFGSAKESASLRFNAGNVQLGPNEAQTPAIYGNHEAAQRNTPYHTRHARNDSRSSPGGFGMQSPSSTAQTIMESIYGTHAASKMLQSCQNASELGQEIGAEQNQAQGMEMRPFVNQTQNSAAWNLQNRSSIHHQSLEGNAGRAVNSQYESQSKLTSRQDHDQGFLSQSNESPKTRTFGDFGEDSIAEGPSSPGSVPPPAPSDPPNGGDLLRKNGPTTGERIFNALRSVTSQSYIDASEFYNSVLSSAQQVQRFTFPPGTRSSSIDDGRSSASSTNDKQMQNEAQSVYSKSGPDGSGPNKSSDLYSPELNLEAHRTAQEVYNSLQDPPSSPLLLKDLSQEPHPYLMDPSFTRTSEEIFNSIEQRRKSMERLNGLHEFAELDFADPSRKRSSQDLYAALEEVQMKRRLSQPSEDLYTGYILGDISELMPAGRRGSQGPEPEPPPDEASLKRAVSCESVCSDTSVVLGDLEEVPVVGHMCVGLEHERWGGRGTDGEGDLAVSVLEARDLVAPDGRAAQDTFARVCLLPDRQTHVQTRLYRGSPSPSYQEKFLFPLEGGPVGRTLHVEVFSVEISMGGGASLLGEASLKLGPAPRPPATTWLALTGPTLPTPHLGELMFSLSYLPTAERLTLVVVKARNLKGANPLPGDFFVKVYLLQQGKKMHKKKTSTKRGEKSPIFNEAIIFSVPAHALQTIQLRLTVAEAVAEPGSNSRAYSVGHIIVGSTASGRSLAHWRQMLAALRRPVAMWHPLRK